MRFALAVGVDIALSYVFSQRLPATIVEILLSKRDGSPERSKSIGEEKI